MAVSERNGRAAALDVECDPRGAVKRVGARPPSRDAWREGPRARARTGPEEGEKANDEQPDSH